LLGNGAGGFGPATNYPVPSQPVSLAVQDFNKDGNPDLAVNNHGGNNVSILLGNGTGGFVPAANFPVGVYPVSVAAGDFNRDGNPDLVSATSTSGSNLFVLLGN